MLRCFAFLFVAAASSLGIVQSLSAAELTIDESKTFVQSLVDSDIVDGVSVGIIDGDRRWTFHLGDINDSGKQPDDRTIYEIGSISKVFTSLLLASASVRGEVNLNEPAEVDGVTPLPKFDGDAITWLDLSTHRSSLPRLPDNMENVVGDDPYATYDSAKASAFLQRHPLSSKPGSKPEYSNFAVSWLGHLLARKSDSTYDALLRDRISQPLGMDDTVVELTKEQLARLATPHSTTGVGGSRWGFADLPGAGGIHSTTTDMMKFMDAQLHPPAGDVGRSIELAWKQHAAGDAANFAMGLGWMIARDNSTRWHNGQTGGYHAAMFVSRDLDCGVVVMANTSVANQVDQVAQLLIQRLAGMKVTPPKTRSNVEVDVDAAAMKRLEGRYELAPTFVFDVRVDDQGRLMVGITNQPTQQVFPTSPTRWFYKSVEAELSFQLGETGPARSLVLYQNGIQQTAKRQP